MASWWFRGYAVWLLCALCAGCGSFSGSSADSDAEFADLELDEETSRLLQPPKGEKSGELKEPPALPELNEPPAKGELGLRLAVGDRFPLQKRVEQRLEQPSEKGTTTGHSQLDVMLSLIVEELRDGKTRFGVRYHRVRYLEQDPQGQTIEYNSTVPTREIPAQARVYAGMVDNGFSFWIGPDNQLVDLVGFNDFVQRCVREVPANQRQAVVNQLTVDKGENGIASFIDDSIGLLPVSGDPKSSRVSVQEGTTWELPSRRIDGPVPMLLTTRCKIKGLSPQKAEIDLFGSIAPTHRVDQEQGWKVSVLGGRCMGSCTVDRSTGLPTNSRVERYVDMLLELPDGSQLPQHKVIITTIQAFLNQDGPPAQASASNVRPISYAESASGTPAPASSDSQRPARPSSDELRLFR